MRGTAGRRALAVWVTTIAALVLTGCSTAHPTQYRIDPAVDRLPVVSADGALTAALPAAVRSHVVATGKTEGASFAIALSRGRCGVAISDGHGTDAVTATAPRSSDDPLAAPDSAAAKRAIGPSTSVAASSSTVPVTLWCGIHGAVVALGTKTTSATTGTVMTLPAAAGTTLFVSAAGEQ